MLKLQIITPEKILLEESDVSIVTARTVVGEVGILPSHIPLYSKLVSGELSFKKNNEEHYIAIHGGFLEVIADTVTILADDAVRAEDIDEETVEEARIRAQEAMEQKVTDEDFAHAEAAMERALLELRVAKKRRNYDR